MFKKIAIVAGLAFALCATSEAQTPRKGGTIRMTAPYGSSFTSLDIHTTQRAQDEIFAKGLYRSLYIWDSAEGKPVPELAKEVIVSGGGLVYTFKLRDDAYFHHGRKMTADDIIWSYNRIMDGSKAYPGARFVRVIAGAAEVEKGEAKEISGLKKIDDFTLEMKLTEKVDPGVYYFTALTSIYPADEAAKEGFIQKPIGLGPFKFVEHVPGSRVVLERFEKFYTPGKPYADKMIVSLMSEAAARDVAFRNKEIDTSVLGPAQYLAYQADPNLKGTIAEVAEVFTRYMGMNPYPFDPATAKALLADAGYPTGFEFEWTTSQNESWGLPIVEAVIPMLDKVGIKVKVKQVETAVLSEVVRKGEFQAYVYSQSTGPDPQAALKCFYSATPQSACNYTSFKNADFDKMIDEAGQTDDAAKRVQLLQKANALLYNEAPVWFFNYNKAVMAVQPWLKGIQLNATELTHQNVEDLWVDETSPAK